MLPLVHPSTQQHPLPATPPPLARTSLLVLVDLASAARPASSSTLSRHRPNTTTYTHAHRHSLAHHRTICIVHTIHSGSALLPPPSPLHPAGARLLLPQPDLPPRRPPPPRRYVCFVNTSASAPSLVATPPPRSRSRCHSSRREYVARSPLVVGRARVGWWALVPGRMGRRRPVSTIPSSPPLLHAPPRARPSPRPLLKRPRAAYRQRSTRVWCYNAGVNGTRRAHPHRPLNSAWPPTRRGARTTLVLSRLRGRQR